MGKIYLTNATGQHRQVHYRTEFTIDGQGRERLMPPRHQTMPARQQMQLGGDFAPDDMSKIITQLERSCNAVSADAIRTAKAKGVVKMIYSIDKPVARPILEDVIAHNMDILAREGADRRRRLAIGASASLVEITDGTAMKTEVEFEQVEEPDEDFQDRLEEGLRVVPSTKKRNAAPPRRPQPRTA